MCASKYFQPSGKYSYILNIKTEFFPTLCTYVFRMILAANSHPFPQEKCAFCEKGPEANVIYINFKLQIGKMKSIITIVKQTVATTQ